RIVILSQGAVVAAGTPDEIRAATGRADLEDAFVHAIGADRETAR
ncbi:MAG: ABC transporter, partial [Gammaproteobacteria bacterium]|nr:ABC transporter [Gammaproteobacteria bacterium]